MAEYLDLVKNHWNETSDSLWYKSLRTDEKIKKIIEDPQSAFHPTTYATIKKYIPDLKGKRILLPSSGDNHAAFAFALLGAKVTSSDISERQLENASLISCKYGMNIDFICDDTMKLNKINNDEFDFVYTSNGTHVWINNLNLMYENIYRILKLSGFSIMYDIHPFNRPFTGDVGEPKIIKPYTDVTSHNHLRIQDLMNAIISSGLIIKHVEEMSAIDASFWFKYEELATKSKKELIEVNNWGYNPMSALPAWLLICMQKQMKK